MSIKEKKPKGIMQNDTIRYIRQNKMIYLFLLPGAILVFLFCYVPLPGLYMAFVDYNPFDGIWGSEFIGLENIKNIIQIPELWGSIVNTVKLSLLNLIFVFPLPLIFALMLNETMGIFKRVVQTVSYLPHFLSTIAVVGIATTIYSSSGIINDIRVAILGEGTQRLLFMGMQGLFVPNIIILTIWQSLGWSSIVYLSAISGIDTALYEAAIIDGAGKWKQCWHITLPSLSTTIILLFILQVGNLLNSNFDLIYGLQNVFIDFEVISTVIYKQGITQGNYSMATAFSFMSGAISLVLILGANFISKKINDVSII